MQTTSAQWEERCFNENTIKYHGVSRDEQIKTRKLVAALTPRERVQTMSHSLSLPTLPPPPLPRRGVRARVAREAAEVAATVACSGCSKACEEPLT